MEIYILFAQRVCSYPGEYAPETLACMSEAEYSDNPDYLHNKKDEFAATGQFTALSIVTVKVSGEAIDKRLFPEQDPVAATVAMDE